MSSKPERMETPICDFVRDYVKREASRMHMPGHKGRPFLGCEPWDITENRGRGRAVSCPWYHCRSEKNAASLFGPVIRFIRRKGRPMYPLHAVSCRTGGGGPERPIVLAARNAHQAFLFSAALLDFDVVWLWPQKQKFPLRLSDFPRSSGAGAGGDGPKALCRVCHLTRLPGQSAGSGGAFRRMRGAGNSSAGRQRPRRLSAFSATAGPSARPWGYGLLRLRPQNAAGADGRRLSPYRKERAGAVCPGCKAGNGAVRLHKPFIPDFAVAGPGKRVSCGRLCGKLAQCAGRVKALRVLLRGRGWPVPKTEPLKLILDAAAAGGSGYALAEKLRLEGVECEYADPILQC